MARIHVNIKLAYLRKQLLIQQKRAIETKQLLFSISNKIYEGINIQDILAKALEEIYHIIGCESLYVLCKDSGHQDLFTVRAEFGAPERISNIIGCQIL